MSELEVTSQSATQSTTQKSLDGLIALVGAPNSGKTTLYNWLTGSKFKTVNYPGATVEYSVGKFNPVYKVSGHVMDTPGTYSLDAKSADEEVTVKALYHHPEYHRASRVIVVVDVTQVSRHLTLVEQMKQTGFSFAVALTMRDLVKPERLTEVKKFIETRYAVPVVAIDGRLGGGVADLLNALLAMPSTQEVRENFEFDIRSLDTLRRQIDDPKTFQLERTLKLDRYLLHPVFGLVGFVLVMGFLFAGIYWLATPFMNAIDGSFAFLNQKVSAFVGENLIGDFLANGIISSFSAVLVFVPQIFILFFGIGILESSGYLARAATLIDRPFSKLGLSGRSFVPILSGFACAVPAIMATRNLSSKRDRLITAFVIPLMTCSARLPVYALLVAFLFSNPFKAGFMLAALYMGALIVGALAAAILNRIIKRDEKSYFMMELPLYRMPQWKVLFTQSLKRTGAYIRKAGPIIFVLAVILWGATTFPHYELTDKKAKMEASYASQLGQFIEPVFKPMGADWRVGVGLISAFAAREVFVSSMAVVFNASSENEDSMRESLLKQMQTATKSDGTLLFTVPSVLALMMFFMIALQCMSTFAVYGREMGSMKLAWVQLVVLNIAAYVIAVAVYHLA